jgi:hypothetical protein
MGHGTWYNCNVSDGIRYHPRACEVHLQARTLALKPAVKPQGRPATSSCTLQPHCQTGDLSALETRQSRPRFSQESQIVNPNVSSNHAHMPFKGCIDYDQQGRICGSMRLESNFLEGMRLEGCCLRSPELN